MYMNMYQGVKTYTFTTAVKIQENMWNLKINTNEFICKTVEDKPVFTSGDKEGRMGKMGVGD